MRRANGTGRREAVRADCCPILILIRQQRGTAAILARELGISRVAVWRWAMVPERHVPTVARLTGISPHRIRPDIYAGYTNGQERNAR